MKNTVTFSREISFSTLKGFESAILKIAPNVLHNDTGLTLEDLHRCSDPHFRQNSYHSFETPKKTGGTRKITASTGKMKDVQKVLACLLSLLYKPDAAPQGFVKERSVVTNALPHIHKNYVLNIDLKDFFPSITWQMVWQALKKYGLDYDTSKYITRVCTWSPSDGLNDSILPQGAPTSPVLSNMVCSVMDLRLDGLARRFCLTYTRYADDITFSSNHSVYAGDSEFWMELTDIIASSGFKINESKTRLQKKGSRQEVTGIIVGEKINVPRRWLKTLRAQIFKMEMFGCSRKELLSINGKLNYLKMVCGEDERYWKLRYRWLGSRDKKPFLEQHWVPGEYYPSLVERRNTGHRFDYLCESELTDN